MARREVKGNARETTLNGGITATATSISVVDATNWPTGLVGKFFIAIDEDTALEEKILVLSRVGNTLTLASSADRGVDDTTAVTHASGAKVRHVATKTDIDEANAHINDTALDHHTQYTNATRHDVTARHTFGAALGTPAAASTSAVGDAAAAGSGTVPSRSDHVHGREAFATTPSTQAIGDAAAGGSATTVTRGDHKHAMPAFGGTGVATTVARSDHTHVPQVGITPITGFSNDIDGVSTNTQCWRVAGRMGSPQTNQIPVVMDRAGSVVGISVALDQARTAGTLTVKAFIDGTDTGLSAVVDGTNTQYSYATQAAGLDTFAAGGRVDVRATNSSFAPAAGNEFEATVVVQYS